MSAARRPCALKIATFSNKDYAKTLSVCMLISQRQQRYEFIFANEQHSKDID